MKISEMVELLNPKNEDYYEIVDSTATENKNKRMSLSKLANFLKNVHRLISGSETKDQKVDGIFYAKGIGAGNSITENGSVAIGEKAIATMENSLAQNCGSIEKSGNTNKNTVVARFSNDANTILGDVNSYRIAIDGGVTPFFMKTNSNSQYVIDISGMILLHKNNALVEQISINANGISAQANTLNSIVVNKDVSRQELFGLSALFDSASMVLNDFGNKFELTLRFGYGGWESKMERSWDMRTGELRTCTIQGVFTVVIHEIY